MKLHHFSFPLLASIILLAVTAASTSAEEIRHSFIGVGKANKTVIVGEDGKVKWRVDLPASDGWVLPNGNVLLALYGTKGFPNGGVVEIDRKTKKFLFQYKGGQKEVSTVVPLDDDKFLVSELGPEPRAVVINRKGEILRNTPLACQKQNAHMQTRMLRVLPNGNYIAPLGLRRKGVRPEDGQSPENLPHR
jgi:hypothetical protein